MSVTDSILIEWGFPELVETFAEQEIDDAALMELDNSTVKELIPKIGPRVKFLKKLQMYKALNKMDIILANESRDNSTGGSVSNISDMDNIDENSSLNMSDITDDCKPSSEIQSDSNLINNEAAEAFKIATSRPYAFSGKDTLATAFRKCYSLNLKEFLSLTNAGKFVLATYKQEKILTRKARNTLVDLLINGLMCDCSGNLTSHDLDIVSKKICELFTTEHQGTYYIPRIASKESVKNKPINAKGKLVDKYRNLKRLYKSNIVKGVEGQKSEINSTITSADEESSATWLRNWTEPWDRVLYHWENTFNLRRNSKVPTVEKFIESWPIFKHKNAYLLIENDFKKMFPTSIMNLYNRWERFFEKLQSIKSALDKTSEELVSNLTMDLNDDSKNAVQIIALAAMFPPKGMIRIKSLHWKPTIVECQESIIDHIKIPGDIENFIKIRKTSFKNQNRSIQPYMIIVGQSITDITEAYLVIDDLVYKANSVLQCFDLLFKAFHVLGAEYPAESEHLWLLIQHLIYNVSTAWDKKIPYVCSAINDLKE